MKLLVLKEKNPHEKRVALTPDLVQKYKTLGFDVFIESQAGEHSGFDDLSYTEHGAHIATHSDLSQADMVLCVETPSAKELKKLKPNTVLIGTLKPYAQNMLWENIVSQQLSAYALDLLPRITRAQSMDVLSSQMNLVGYRSVLVASYHLEKAFPMMMTAAGTIHPAKVLILGVGVAGLQAIATAKRLGAVVSAYDVRSVVKEQVESLGASFVDMPTFGSHDGDGGYAKALTKEQQEQQQEFLAHVIEKQDVVITTALVPGKKAPILLTKAMVERMKQGSVVVDCAIEMGGNCAISKAGEIIHYKGVKVVAPFNLASDVAHHASQLYAKNLFTFIQNLFAGCVARQEDEIIQATQLAHHGIITNPLFQDKIPLVENQQPILTEKKESSQKTTPRKSSKPKTAQKKDQ